MALLTGRPTPPATCARSATSDQDGRSDGQQIMVRNGYAYIGHVCSQGLLGHRRARPEQAEDGQLRRRTRPTPGACTCRSHDDLLLLVHGRDMFAQPEMADERNYYKPKAGRHDDHADAGDAELVRRHGRLRHLQAGGAAPDRLHAGRGHRPPPHLVRRRPLGLRLGDDRRLLRLHPRHHRHGRPDQAARSSADTGCPA